jgi:SAM-dependent methyltransferase
MAGAIVPRILANCYRHDVVHLLGGSANVGVELGVAEGVFSERMVRSGRFARFFGVDMYADLHDTAEYKRALRRVGLMSNYSLLRMRFDEAIDLFDDGTLDFVYVDGYAHGGEEGGETIFQWARKLRPGGVLAGDDYHRDWPLVVESVDEFVRRSGLELLLTERTESDSPYCRYPTWAVVVKGPVDCEAPREMVERGKAENARVAALRAASRVAAPGAAPRVPAPAQPRSPAVA